MAFPLSKCSEEYKYNSLIVSNFSCTDILFNQSDYEHYQLSLAQARVYMKTRRFGKPSFTDYFKALAQNCTKFKSVLGYRISPLEDEDPDFPIAYNILLHDNVAQFERLFRAIYRPQNSYCIHIDAKSTPSFKTVVKTIVGCFQNAFIASKLELVVYAGYSRLLADINCMKDQLSSPIKWRYLLNTAANAYPLKTNAEIVKILKIYNGTNDIRAVMSKSPYLVKRWNYEYYERKSGPFYVVKTAKRPYRPPPHNLTIVKGSAYAAFSRDFVHYLVNDKIAKDFLEWCRLTYSPDEHFWNTLHHTLRNPHINPPGSYAGKYRKS